MPGIQCVLGAATMKGFPKSREEIRLLAEELVKFLKGEMDATLPAKDWKTQNFKLLTTFFRDGYCSECRFTGSTDGGEFLWDFHGYADFKGMLITAESEYNASDAEIDKDFDRLIYGISPIKLMICRIRGRYESIDSAKEEAKGIRVRIEKNLQQNSIQHCSGEVFILYCAWWAGGEAESQDLAYILQVDGEPNYVPVREDQHFEPFPN